MDSPIDASEGPNTAHQLTNPSIKPTDPGPCEVKVQNLTAKVFLNRPVEDLVPVRFLREAENTCKISLSLAFSSSASFSFLSFKHLQLPSYSNRTSERGYVNQIRKILTR